MLFKPEISWIVRANRVVIFHTSFKIFFILLLKFHSTV